jgi:hypothetical protein
MEQACKADDAGDLDTLITESESWSFLDKVIPNMTGTQKKKYAHMGTLCFPSLRIIFDNF